MYSSWQQNNTYNSSFNFYVFPNYKCQKLLHEHIVSIDSYLNFNYLIYLKMQLLNILHGVAQ